MLRRIAQHFGERAEPETREQIGSSSLSSVTGGGTAFNRMRRAKYESMDSVLEEAEKASPEFAKRRAEKRGKEARAGVMSEYNDMVSERKGAEASEAGVRTAARARVAPSAAPSAAPAPPRPAPAPAATTKETLPSVDAPSRAVVLAERPTVASTAADAEAVGQRVATPSSTISGDRIQSLFKKATGTSFDPKSRKDRAALAELEAVVASRPDLADANDTKIALAWYKSKKK